MRAAAILILVLFAACMIAGVCLAAGPQHISDPYKLPAVAERPSRWLESPHAGQCESQWLRMTRHNGYQRTWVYRDGEVWHLTDGATTAYYHRDFRHGDRY